MNANKEIYWRQKDKWELQDGIHASDIAVDAKGPAWVLGAEPDAEGNFAIYQDDGYHGKFDGWRWRKLPGSATRIVMQQNGVPWILKKDGRICRSNLKPPTHNLICAGLRGMVKIAPDGAITRFDKGGRGIAFDAKGNLFAANGTDILKFAPGEMNPAVYESGLDRAWALTLDPQGSVLFTEFRNIKDEPTDKPDRKDGATYKLSPDHVKTIFDEHTPYAYGLATDAQGDIYLAGYGNGGDIYKYAIAGPCVTKSRLATIPFARPRC